MNNDEKLREIWNTYNVSTILILPLFSHIIDNIRTNKNEKLNIIGFLLENGLVNTFLFNSRSNSKYYTLTLSFTEELVINTLNIKQLYPSLLDILINSKEFEYIFHKDGKVNIVLKIDNKWDSDIANIVASRYSHVSNEYKEAILFKGVCKDSGPISNYIHINNIPARIVYKSKKLENVLIDLFYEPKDKAAINGEYYELFDKVKETI